MPTAPAPTAILVSILSLFFASLSRSSSFSGARIGCWLLAGSEGNWQELGHDLGSEVGIWMKQSGRESSLDGVQLVQKDRFWSRFCGLFFAF